MSKCQRCIYGAIHKTDHYTFSTITKKINNKIITLNYICGDSGCRMSQWTDKEIKCLNNDFSEFQSK
jgi:hypothetical protein